MENKQYSIGEFAAINKVSARMLRHYDKIGLMMPKSILSNGYRCYDENQIEQISQIKQLRSCGFLLDEIADILQNNCLQFLEKQANRKLVELQGQAVQQQNEMQALNMLLQEIGVPMPPSTYGVSLITQCKTTLLVCNKMIDINSVEADFDALFHLVHQQKLCTTGCAVLLNYFDKPDENQNILGVPISKSFANEEYHTIVMPSTSAISVIHYGDYFKIGHAYNALLSFAQQYDYPISNIIMERYFIDSSHGAASNQYVTEISSTFKNTP